MEEFLNMDWIPPLEDIIDTKFVDSGRMQREAAMYRLLRGNFNDPFEDIHEDYEALVTPEMLTEIHEENKEKKQQSKKVATPTVKPKTVVQVQERSGYVPGLGNKCRTFPRMSNLNAEQHDLCLRVMLRFSGPQKPEISAADNADMKTYMNILPSITEEQEEYCEFVKKNWDGSKFKIHEEEFINQQWSKKVKLIENIPRYYTEVGNIPLVSGKEIGVNYDSTCLEMGTLPRTILPTFTKRFNLPKNTTKINQRFFAERVNDGSRKPVIFKTPVSQDPNCDKLAKVHGADLVISSAGLNCLAVNMDPQNTISWILPVVVKRVNDRNVAFVDKPLPPTGRTVMQKNAWFHKYTLKSFAMHPYHVRAFNLDENDTETFCKRRQMRHWDSTESIDSAKTQEETAEPMEISGTDTIGSRGNDKVTEENDEFVRPPADHNLFYRLFGIGSCGEPQNELMKDKVDKQYKLLVRAKGDGVIRAPSGEQQLIMIAPKLEHQLEMGAEAVTAEEAAKQWMSLTFRPDTCLARVRIDAVTSEVIQVERRYPNSINNEIQRLYNLKTDAALTLLYNVTEMMTSMNPGAYLIRHTIRNGAFASVHKEADGPGKNVLDLQTVYCENEFRTIPNPPWPMLDKNVVTPAHQFLRRVPALFRPRAKMNGRGKMFNKGNNTKPQQDSKRGGLRKSVRNKGSPTPE